LRARPRFRRALGGADRAFFPALEATLALADAARVARTGLAALNDLTLLDIRQRHRTTRQSDGAAVVRRAAWRVYVVFVLRARVVLVRGRRLVWSHSRDAGSLPLARR
jgi:hypothetical protein